MALVLSLLVLPISLSAQATGTRGRQGGPPMAGRYFESILAQRAELGLTDAQVTQLQQISSRLQEKNRPLMERMRAAGIPEQSGQQMREMTTEQRRAMREKMEPFRPVMQEMRENSRAAMDEAREVFTEQQRDRLREMMRERRDGQRGDRPQSRHGSRAGPRR